MASKRYRAVRKRDRKGVDAWGVAAFEPVTGKPWRQVAWKTVGRSEKAEIEARVLAVEMERQEAEHGERFRERALGLPMQSEAWGRTECIRIPGIAPG